MPNTPQNKISESNQAKLADAERQSNKARTKLILMSVGLVVCIGAYLVSSLQEQKHLDRQGDFIEVEAPFVETVATKKFDMSGFVDTILDERSEDRVLLPSSVTMPFTDYVYGMNDGQFHALGLQTLDQEQLIAITGAPGDYRGKAFRVRGRLQEIKLRKLTDGKIEYKGWLLSKEDQVVHFIVMDAPPEIDLNGYMRFDGLFVKLYSREDHDGGRANGPLFVGSRIVPSFPQTEIESLNPEQLLASLASVTDDTARDSTGLDGAVYDAQWLLMDYLKSEHYKNIDWEKDAIELNNETMTAILKDGDDWRYRLADGKSEDPRAEPEPLSGARALLEEDMIPIPIRIPVCKNMGVKTQDPGENPARLNMMTSGWVGNWQWTNQAGVLKFVMPEYRPELADRYEDAKLVQGRGFFLKNHNYESKDHGTRTAPFFVLTELEVFHPVEDSMADSLMWGVLALSLLVIAAIPFFLLRDRKKAAAREQEVVRRKQERRRATSASQPSA
ncbi:MAG: hypothetical protein ACI8X5_003058 [Planctomycetota bacterium]|jgi:hypothetical protein